MVYSRAAGGTEDQHCRAFYLSGEILTDFSAGDHCAWHGLPAVFSTGLAGNLALSYSSSLFCWTRRLASAFDERACALFPLHAAWG